MRTAVGWVGIVLDKIYLRKNKHLIINFHNAFRDHPTKLLFERDIKIFQIMSHYFFYKTNEPHRNFAAKTSNNTTMDVFNTVNHECFQLGDAP